MPPETPRTILGLTTWDPTTCGRDPPGVSAVTSGVMGLLVEVVVEGGGLAAGLLGGELGRVDVLTREEVVVDLAQRDRQGLLLDVGVDQWADVLEQALAQLGVVGVNLAGALGAVEDQLVLAVGLGQQVVDRGVGHALGGDVGSGHA